MILQIPNITPQLPDSIPSVDKEVSMLSSLSFDELISRLISTGVTFVINLAIAILVFYLGRLIINKLYKFISGIFVKRRLDQSLATFVLSLVRIVLYFLLIVTVIGILGIETSSFIALFASAGVAIGMALSGTLQNFAGGVLILLLKPYKIGDFIETQGYSGTVRDIQIFSTIICTPDNKSIIIPNGGLSTGTINNYNKEDYRRVDWVVSISYGDDVDVARKAILDIIASDDRIVSRFIEDDRKKRLAEEAVKEAEEKQNRIDETIEEEPRRGLWRIFGHKRRPSIPKPEDLPSPSEIFNTQPKRLLTGSQGGQPCSKQRRHESERMDPLRLLLGRILRPQRTLLQKSSPKPASTSPTPSSTCMCSTIKHVSHAILQNYITESKPYKHENYPISCHGSTAPRSL